ncbi:hypothetical protein TSUD_337060, partial [Trifolium subterraneum]
MSYSCPFAQRVWITRNYKGLQDKIKLVPIDLQNKPAWYKEKVHPENKDPAKKEFGEELIKYVDTFTKDVFGSFKGDSLTQASASFEYLENALGKFDGPFFLGEFSLVDIVYIPFIERFQIAFSELYKHDITAGRPKFATWIEELNNNDAYKQTKLANPQEFVGFVKKVFLGQ